MNSNLVSLSRGKTITHAKKTKESFRKANNPILGVKNTYTYYMDFTVKNKLTF